MTTVITGWVTKQDIDNAWNADELKSLGGNNCPLAHAIARLSNNAVKVDWYTWHTFIDRNSPNKCSWTVNKAAGDYVKDCSVINEMPNPFYFRAAQVACNV